MRDLILYINRNIVYSYSVRLRFTYYLRTNYIDNITIHSDNAYQKFLENKLLMQLTADIEKAFNFYNIDIIGNITISEGQGIIINFQLKDQRPVIRLFHLCEAQISGDDPLMTIHRSNNTNIIKFEIEYMESLDQKLLCDNIIKSVDAGNIVLYKDRYDKLVFSTDTTDGSIRYLIKAVPNTFYSDDLFHEAFICHMINRHVKLPNFPKFIGISRLDVILDIPKMNLGSSKLLKTTYLISEYIEASKFKESLDKLAPTPGSTSGRSDVAERAVTKESALNKKRIISILKQIVYTIHDTYQELEFTHYDLHDENLLIQFLDKEITVEYSREIITTDVLVILIDLEFSHVGVSTGTEREFGVDYPPFNIYNRKFWLHDIFKIFMSMFGTLNNFITSKVGSDLEFFQDILSESLEFLVGKKMTRELYKSYLKINKLLNLRECEIPFQFDKFIDYFLSVINMNYHQKHLL